MAFVSLPFLFSLDPKLELSSAERVKKQATQAMQCCDCTLCEATLLGLAPRRSNCVDSSMPLDCDMMGLPERNQIRNFFFC